MNEHLQQLKDLLEKKFGQQAQIEFALNELTLTVKAENYLAIALQLKQDPQLGVDYQSYKDGTWDGLRFAAVSHLLSIQHNWRLRLIAFAPNDDFPVLASVNGVWNSVNWFEREAFDLFGIIFEGHDDLRRILTDYGFIGHPFRKDFPVTGHVEMRYDPEQKRVVYQPVTVETREVTPRVIREESYGS